MRFVAFLLLSAPAWFFATSAWGSELGGESPCIAAAAQAETERGVPPGLLAAIGRIESGRWNPVSRRTEPWPWAVNAAGSGRYHPSQDQAIEDVRREQSFGTRSIDVGCFQVSLLHHPGAFVSLDEAFDPLANARYAARFLQTLWTNSGSWEVAVGQYHSATPGLGEPYRQQVLASWNNGGQGRTHSAPMMAAPVQTVMASMSPGSRRTEPARAAPSADPHVILVRATGTSIRVDRGLAATDPHVINVGQFLTRRRT